VIRYTRARQAVHPSVPGSREAAVQLGSPPADPCARTRFLADPARTAYHAYGLGRNSVLRVYGPRILWHYVKWGMQGKPIGVTDDTLQRGRLSFAHTGTDQSDRPPPERILAALRQR